MQPFETVGRMAVSTLAVESSAALRKAVAITALATAQLFSLYSASAAELARPVNIGVLTIAWNVPPAAVGLRDGLVELGYRENVDFAIGTRFTQGQVDSLYKGALDLVSAGSAILFATGDVSAIAASRATSRVPIVFAMESDPVKLGLVASFARPGGNATGITDRTIELAGKRLEMFARIVPGLRRVLYPYEDSSITEREQASAYRKAARRLGIELIERVPRTQDEAKRILTGLRGKKIEGVLSPWNIGLNIPGFILDASLQQKVPAMFGFPFFVERGGLASYGPSLRSAGRLAARVIDKIIMGASPAEVPVEVNTKIQFAVNQKTAKSMGLNIAPEVLYQATRIVR